MIAPGTYCNKNLYKNVENATSFSNPALIQIFNKEDLYLVAKDPSNKPVLKTDGWYGIHVNNSTGIEITNLEI